MDKCIICGNESEEMLEFQVDDDFSFFICDDCLAFLKNGGRISKTFASEGTYGEELSKAITEWLEYKKSRKENYTETGYKSLMTRIANEVKRTNEKIVAKKIRNSIAFQWHGIGWAFGAIPDKTVEHWFNMTFNLGKNKEGKAEAFRIYKSLFKMFDDEKEAHDRAATVYLAFKKYIEALNDDKFCKTFSKWLRAEIPNEWWGR